MVNKKVSIIPPANFFDKYIKIQENIVRIACYSAVVLPFHDVQEVQRYYSSLLKFGNWKIAGVYTDDNGIQNNENNFEKLLSMCRYDKIDVVVCDWLEHLPERPEQLIEQKIPIYVFEKGLLINNESYSDILELIVRNKQNPSS